MVGNCRRKTRQVQSGRRAGVGSDGVKKGNIRVYLTKAYDQKNWSQFIVDLEREASRYQRKRKLGQVVRSLTVRKKGHPSSDRWLFFRYKCL